MVFFILIKLMQSGSKRFVILTRAIGVTLLALLLSFVLSSPMTASLSGLFSNPERKDFRTTDLYAQVADGRPVRQWEDRIVMVDIEHAGREEIAECLEILALCEPKAVGLDVNFARPTDNDSVLINAITSLPGLVLPLGLDQTEESRFSVVDKPFFYEELPGLTYGVVNFPAESSNASIREYAVKFSIDNGDTIPSFPMALAKIGDPDKAALVLSRGTDQEIIDYPSREFRIIKLGEVADNAENLTGRYVLIGALSEASDMHATPIDSYLSGMQIHAYSLSSLLDGSRFTEMPRWVDILLASLSCFLIIYLALSLQGKLRGVALRFVQVAILIGTVLFGYIVYIDRSLICNFSHTILMMAFSLFALDVWNGLEWVVTAVRNGLKKLKKENI